MDQRAVIQLEVEKEGRKYVFTMPVGAPLGEVYDVAFSVLGEILKISKEAVEKAKPAEPTEDIVEEEDAS